MDVPDDQRLLVVNLENCIPNTVAVASNTCGPQDGTVIQIPVSVHCSERTQQHYAQVPVQQYTQINVGNEVSSLAASSDSENQILNSEQQAPSLSKADEESSCEEVDSYYEEIFNYLVSQTVPEGCTDKYRKLLHKRARFYKIYNGMLYYGHKQSREVIAEKAQQRQILKDVHIDKLTDIHLGLKKMYVAISQSYFWKGLYVDVANFVRQCKLCSESTLQEDNNEEFHDTETPSQSEKVTKEKGDSSESPNKVWQKVELNILGPYPRTANHNEFIVAITDPFSRWIVARPMDSDFLVETLSDFLFTTFCTFGFTKCNFVGMSEETFEAVQTNYRNRISRIQETLRSDSMKNFIPLLATGTNSLSLLSEDLCECIWLRRHWTEFVSHYPQTWDVEMETFLFKYHTSHRKEASSPFTIMFGRSPNIYVEEDKENCDMVENDTLAEKISKRRRLQSSILQFADETQPLFFIFGNFDYKERLMAITNHKVQTRQEDLLKDSQRAEIEATTVDAVKKLLASTKEERRRRGRYHKYSAEIQEEMAIYAMEHGSLEAVKHFSQKMGRSVSESTIRNIVKLYRNFTPGLKEEIGRFALCFGVEAACSNFSEKLGMTVRRGLVHKFRKLYLNHHPEIDHKQMNSNKDKGRNSKQKTAYTSELKDEIGSHAWQFGISSAVEHFAPKLPSPPKESTVRKFRKLFVNKNHAAQQSTMLQQPVNVQDTVGPSAQTIDILHTSFNILNNSQIGGPTAVVYNTPFHSATIPQIQPTSHLIPSSNSSNTVPLTFHTVNSSEANASSTMSFQQPTPITAPVIMNQNTVAFSQSPIPMHSLYSSFNNQGQINDKSAIVTVPQPELAHHSISQVPASSIPTITFAIASPGQQNFQNISTNPTVVMPHQSQSAEASNLSSQPSILVSHEPNGTTVVQQLVASSLSHSHLHENQQHPRDLQQNLSQDIMNSSITNPSQVLVQQPSVISDPILVNHQTLPSHSQIVEQHNLESATYLHTLSDSTSIPFDTTGSTLIADRDGTYSLATAVSNDVSITVNKDAKDNQEEETMMIETQEIEAPRETDDVISVVSQNDSEETEIESAVEVAERAQEKNFQFVNENCHLEEDVDDPESPERLPKKKKKKKMPSSGNKRGNYTMYSPEIRAKMGKYAAEHGSHKASRYFKSILGHDVPESTIRGLRDKYLLKRENCLSNSGKDKEITTLGYAYRGRPMRLGKYDKVVQDCIRQLIKSGEKVSSFLVITTAKQVLMQFEPGLLEENGGKVKLNTSWAKSFLKRIKKKNLLLQSEGASNENVCADNNVYIYLDDITNSASSVSDNALYSIENDSSSPNSPVQTSNENCQILCNSCKYESLTKGGLDRHEKIYHNPNDRQFACKYCSYRGEKQRQLADHEKTVHGHPQNRTRFRQTLYLHIKNSHPGETFKTMGKGPSDADFQEIIDTALQNLEPFLPCEEQNMAADYINQNPEDSSNYLNVPVQASNPFPAVTCTEEASSSQILTLQKYKSSAPVMNNTLVNHKVVDDLNAGIMQSDHAVAVIDSSGEVQTVVNLTGKKKIQSLFPLNSFHFEGSKIQQVVTLVDSLHAVEETNEHAVMLLDNVVEKSTEHRTVTHISLANNQNLGQENLVILPLGDSNVAIIQNENFSTVQGDNPLVLDHQTALLDLIPEQTEIIHNN
ncbi:hypothetical protein C0J52_17643 [Blattella germanica]|nr:hypothetical protein C0J52_17643 [Blattella germanica]